MTAVELARELDIHPDAIAVFLDIAAKKAVQATLPPDPPPTINAPGASPTNHGATP